MSPDVVLAAVVAIVAGLSLAMLLLARRVQSSPDLLSNPRKRSVAPLQPDPRPDTPPAEPPTEPPTEPSAAG